jgi:RNA polymerase sigma factor (TIGR02999 family)
MGTLRPKPGGPDNSITALLSELSRGDRSAEARLIPQIYQELHRVAGRYMRSERLNHTLQPTALVHEAYARLVQQPRVAWQSRAHFFAVASGLMRHILVDHARARNAEKRGGVQAQVTLDDAILSIPNQSVDVLALHEAMEKLAQLDERQGRIVELHFFAGLSFEEIGSVIQVAPRTVKRDWSMARAFLKGQLTKKP